MGHVFQTLEQGVGHGVVDTWGGTNNHRRHDFPATPIEEAGEVAECRKMHPLVTPHDSPCKSIFFYCCFQGILVQPGVNGHIYTTYRHTRANRLGPSGGLTTTRKPPPPRVRILTDFHTFRNFFMLRTKKHTLILQYVTTTIPLVTTIKKNEKIIGSTLV